MDPHTWLSKSKDDQHEHTFSNYVRIRDVVQKTCQRGNWTIGKSGERGSGISVLPARHDDDDDYYFMHRWRKTSVFLPIAEILTRCVIQTAVYSFWTWELVIGSVVYSCTYFQRNLLWSVFSYPWKWSAQPFLLTAETESFSSRESECIRGTRPRSRKRSGQAVLPFLSDSILRLFYFPPRLLVDVTP